jgi:hypothetical protein
VNQALKKACAILNEALQADPEAIKALLNIRVPCNQALAEHPTIQVRGYDARGKLCPPSIGVLGLINGISDDPNYVIAMEIDDSKEDPDGPVTPLRFIAYGPDGAIES